MQSTETGYKAIKRDDQRVLGKLHKTKQYLMWYHHLLPTAVWKKKLDAVTPTPRPSKKTKHVR